MAKAKKNIKVRDLKPNKDAKGGFGTSAHNPHVNNPHVNNPHVNNPVTNNPHVN
jgi:hypothetical protein